MLDTKSIIEDKEDKWVWKVSVATCLQSHWLTEFYEVKARRRKKLCTGSFGGLRLNHQRG